MNAITEVVRAQVTIRSAPPEDFSDLQPDQIEAHLKWHAKVEGYRADAMFALVKRFDELLRKDGRFPHTVRTELRRRLDELRTWRNALCHGAWSGFSAAGAGVLSHYCRERKQTVQSPPMVTLKDLVDLRARIVNATIRVVEASAVAASGSALAVVLARKFELRNREPEQEQGRGLVSVVFDEGVSAPITDNIGADIPTAAK